MCSNTSCTYVHFAGFKWPGAAAGQPAPRTHPSVCRYGAACRDQGSSCTRIHPEPQQQGSEDGSSASVVVRSKLFGTSMYNRLRTYYGDDLEGLNNKVGATVSYVEIEDRLKVQVGADKATKAKATMDQLLDQARRRVASEYNELSIVGSTRFVVEQGCVIKNLLTGREASSLFAVGVPRDANGVASKETSLQLKAIMSVYGDVNIHSMKWSGKDGIKVAFVDPETAAKALAGLLVAEQQDKLWTSLQPFIQVPRESTMTQVFKVKVAYDLHTAQPMKGENRNMLIWQMLAPFGAEVFDVQAFPGNKETGKGYMLVRLPSMPACTDAIRALNGEFFPKLCRQGGVLEVTLQDAEFTVCVSTKKFKAVQDQLHTAQQQHQVPWLELVLPQELAGGIAAIKLRVNPEAGGLPAWADIKAKLVEVRRVVELILQGTVMDKLPLSQAPLTREDMLLLANKNGWEQLRKIEEDIRGVAIATEKESSRLRLFGNALAIQEAMTMIEVLLVSLKFSDQVTTVPISAAAAAMLSGNHGLQLLAQMSNETGSSICELLSDAGGPAIKAVGTPAAILAVRRSVQQLEKLTRKHNRQVLELTDADILDTTCPVCLSEVAPGSRHIMEPCGHLYCPDCAAGHVKSAVEQAKFPVTCCKGGCQQPVCLEDIKMLMGSAQEYDKALQLSLSCYMRQKAGAGVKPCFTPGCKQVYKGTALKFECDHCLETYCTSCTCTWHEGQTCQEYKAALQANSASAGWVREHTRPCGGCGAPYYKDGGCNRLVCGSCKSHLCNICSQVFASSAECYAHLTAAHGGYY